MQASKWIKLPLLLDEGEMSSFFEHLQEKVSPFSLYQVQGVSLKGEGVINPEIFLNIYSEYISCLKQGKIPDLAIFRHPFSYAISRTSKTFDTISVGNSRQLIKTSLPVVQMQANQIRYSSEENRFRTQVFGNDTISWGIQLAYPQIFQDPNTHDILSVRELPNTSFFQTMQKWVRQHTVPTPFIVNKKRLNEPIRLGKECFSWIGSHPQLKNQGIVIHGA